MEAPEELRGLARDGLSKIAARELKARGPRMDAVFYLLDAVRLFRGKSLQEAARAPAARPRGKGCKGEGAALAEAEALKLQARLEDLNVWQMKKVKQSRRGSKTYT